MIHPTQTKSMDALFFPFSFWETGFLTFRTNNIQVEHSTNTGRLSINLSITSCHKAPNTIKQST